MVKKVTNEIDTILATTQASVPKQDLVKGTMSDINSYNNQDVLGIEKIQPIIDVSASSSQSSKAIMELLPDLELVKKILIASILSPKDLIDIRLKIALPKGAPPNMAEAIRKHFTTVYNIEKDLEAILERALFEVGSDAILILSQTAIQKMINSVPILKENQISNESFSNTSIPNVGYLDIPSDKLISLEGYIDTCVKTHNISEDTKIEKGSLTIVDNFLHIAMPCINDRVFGEKTGRLLDDVYCLENFTLVGNGGSNIPRVTIKPEDEDVKQVDIYPNREYELTPLVSLGEQPRETLDINPLIINLSHECTIPVRDSSGVLGYFIALDETGNPLSTSNYHNSFKQLSDRLDRVVNNNAKTNLPEYKGAFSTYVTGISENGFMTPSNRPGLKDYTLSAKVLLDTYIRLTENELRDSVVKSGKAKTITVGRPMELYRMMYSRHLANQKTKLLYVPDSCISYIAFDYNEFGIGVSLIEKAKLYASFRAILVFANLMGGIRNSINARVLILTLDPADPDPYSTAESMMAEFASMQASGLPIGRWTSSDIIESLVKAAVQVEIDGGARFPNCKMALAEANKTNFVIDQGLMDEIQKVLYAALWTTVEEVNQTLEGQTATATITNSLLKAKRVAHAQTTYNSGLSERMQKYIKAGGALYKELTAIYAENKCTLSFDDIIAGLSCIFPKSDTASLQSQFETYQKFEDFVDKVYVNHISDDIITGLLKGKNLPDAIPVIKNAVLSLIKRNYLRSENMLSEIDSLLYDKDNDVAEFINQHIETISEIATAILKVIPLEEAKLDKEIDAANAKLNPVETPEGAEGEGTSDTGVGEDTGEKEGGESTDFGDEGTADETSDTTEDEAVPDEGTEEDDGGVDDMDNMKLGEDEHGAEDLPDADVEMDLPEEPDIEEDETNTPEDSLDLGKKFKKEKTKPKK